MTDPTSPGVKALLYAEQMLEVHRVYEKAVIARDKLDSSLIQLNGLRAEKRMEEQSLRDLEMELMEEERSKNPDESVAAFERRFKVVVSNNGDIRASRARLAGLADEIDETERVTDILAKDIQIAVARMGELGGYFHYLAVIKQAEAASQHQTSQTGNPW